MVAILLSTYNGEKYLTEQLSSILYQSYSDFILYIVDDGSIDNTVKVIDEFCSKDERIIKLTKESKHDGAAKSFIWLLEQITADFYFFCDQDDVWFKDKIDKSLALAKQCVQDKPILIHSDLQIVDDTMQVLHNSFWDFNGSKPSEFSSFKFHCAYNNIPGCTMLINKTTRDLTLPMPKTAKMHDAWIALVVSFNKGLILSINEPLIYYRQHSNNTIGARKSRSILDKFFYSRLIFTENINLYKTINALKPINIFEYVLNKIKIYSNL